MIMDFLEFTPVIGRQTWIAANAFVIGKCTIGIDCSIWFGSVVRGDVHRIEIGDRTNIQDNSILHVTGPSPENEDGFPLIIGDDVTVGHKVTLHGCRIGNGCLIGMSATVLDDAEIGDESLVGAGSLVTQHKKFPPRSLIIGSPAKFVRNLTDQEVQSLYESSDHYVKYKNLYLSTEK